MPRTFDPLPTPRSRKQNAAPRSICIVTGEVSGPDVNGGIGTANLGLALALQAAGHDVEILYTRVAEGVPYPSAEGFAFHAAHFARLGLTLTHIDHSGAWNDWLGKSHSVLENLRAPVRDLVLFNDTHGNGFASLLAKRTGLPELRDTRMAVFTHSASQWIFDLNEQPIADIADIRLIEQERRSVELADTVISPSAYLLETYASYGWDLPKQSYVHPNILPLPNLPASRSDALNGPPDELVFFGRLETRKGLWLFCNALDRIRDRLAGKTVTFLGKSVLIDGRASTLRLLDRAKAWPFDIRMLTDLDSKSALAYLARRRCVVVMPSIAENSPCAISECLAARIPFIATEGSGAQELVAQVDRSRVLVEPRIAPLVEKLRAVLDDGLSPASPAYDSGKMAKKLVEWLAAAPASSRPKKRLATSENENTPCLLIALPRSKTPIDQEFLANALNHLPAGSNILAAGSGSTSNVAIERAARAELPEKIRKKVRTTKGPIIVCASDIIVTQATLERAMDCFRAAPDVVAVSGLVGTVGQAPNSYAFGPSVSLKGISRDSNQGFAIFRNQGGKAIAHTSPYDRTNDRLLPAQTWIHRIFADLMADGQQCELLPDLLVDGIAHQANRTFEGFDPILDLAWPAAARPPILEMAEARLLKHERHETARNCLADLIDRIDDDPLFTGPIDGPTTTMTLANLAHRAGQPEVAQGFCADILSRADFTAGDDNRRSVGRPVSEIMHRQANTISLFDLALQGDVEKLNLGHPWSYKVLPRRREIEMHPNTISEGRALLRFADVDLARIGQVFASVELPQRSGKQVVCRVEVASRDSGDRHVEEVSLAPGGRTSVSFNLPPALRRNCQINLSVFMAYDIDKTEDSWVRWHDPILLPALTELT